MYNNPIIMGMETFPGRASRFLPVLEEGEFKDFIRRKLPQGWMLWREGEIDVMELFDMPVIFDRLGPKDPRPLIASWVNNGRLDHDRHKDVEIAADVVRGFFDVGSLQFDSGMMDGSRLRGTDPVMEHVPEYVRLWHRYELSCAELSVTVDNLSLPGNLWNPPVQIQEHWDAFTLASNSLKTISTAIASLACREHAEQALDWASDAV